MKELELEKKMQCIAIDYDGSLLSIRRIEYHCYSRNIPCTRRYSDNHGKFEEVLTLIDSTGRPHVVPHGSYIVFYPYGHGFEVANADWIYNTFTVFNEIKGDIT